MLRLKFGFFVMLAISGCESAKEPPAESSNVFQQQAKKLSAPVAEKIPYELTSHGETRVDNYYWMRDDKRQDPKIISHLEAENAYTKGLMAPVKALEDELFEELSGRLEKDDSDVPYLENGYWYYGRFSGDQEYKVQYRRKDEPEAPEELLYDANQLAEGFEFFSISQSAVSPNNQLLGYAVDTVGRRSYDIYFMALSADNTVSDVLKDTTGSFEWANDNSSIYYMTRDPQTLLGNKVWRHVLGTNQEQDELVYEEADTTFYTYIYKSTDRNSIFIAHSHTDKKGASVIDANDPKAKPELFHAIEENLEYSVDSHGGSFYVRTNYDAKDFRLMRVEPGKQQDKANWQEVIPHIAQQQLEQVAYFDNHLVYLRTDKGKQKVYISDLAHKEVKPLLFNDDIFQAYLYANREPSNSSVRFYYNSPTTPATIMDIDLNSQQQTVRKTDKVLGGFDSSNYQAEFIFVKARDGKDIPVTVVYRKDQFNKDGSNPLVQFGYGSYGVTMRPNFSENTISLLDRGFVYATAHVRGSQKLGRQWYEDGKLNNKKNTFYDFIDVTKAMAELGYADAEKVYAIGGSAGGLLMGAINNMAPELYHGIVAAVPFVDVITTMQDESIPLTSNEWSEWGNPITDKDAYAYMLSYSPYDNVTAMDYPNLLITTSLHDSQVGYFEASKWTAKLREFNAGDNVIMLDTNMEAGHGGASGRFKRLRDTAKRFAFFCTLADACELANEGTSPN